MGAALSMVQPLMFSKCSKQTHKHSQRPTGCMHHAMTGFCQVGALTTLSSQQLDNGKPCPVAAGKTEVGSHLRTVLRRAQDGERAQQ